MNAKQLPGYGNTAPVISSIAGLSAALDPDGATVWCDFAEREAHLNDGFCQYCGRTDHMSEAPVYREDDEDAEANARIEATRTRAPKLTSRMTAEELARTVATERLGFTGRSGGWIYDQTGTAICQGWSSLAATLKRLGYIEVGVGVHWRKMDLAGVTPKGMARLVRAEYLDDHRRATRTTR